ncbi:MAG: T9SS type A sorting domain-containing protein [Saprospiraceae bacterium]|nr:T9SS type A sorting domain-containing protein [Saprospiraceae bacterium]
MKKQLLIIITFCALSIGANAQNDTIAAWNFSTGIDTVDIYPNVGLSSNLGRYISAEDTTEWPNTVIRTITMTNGLSTGDYAATAEGWDNGKDAKLWSIKFKAEDYTNLKISSKQRSGGSKPGPRDWKLQCRFSGDTWVDIPNGVVICANDWTTGVVNSLALPPEFNNPGSQSIYIRWIMTSDTSVTGTIVASDGTSKIDDVVITGTYAAGVEGIIYSSILNAYPNPAYDYINIESSEKVQSITIFTIEGKVVKQIEMPENFTKIDTEGLKPGIYMIHTMLSDFSLPHINKIIVQ